MRNEPNIKYYSSTVQNGQKTQNGNLTHIQDQYQISYWSKL